MRSLLTSLMGFGIVALVAAGDARAADCGNVTEAGLCQDPKTLVYCAKGVLETLACPEDEICVDHHEFFDGGSGCVKPRYAGCGDITEVGRCVGDTVVLYCDGEQVTERTCDAGWRCGLVAANREGAPDYYDCVPDESTAPTESDASAGSDADAGTPPASDDSDAGTADPDGPATEPSFAPDALAAPTVERGGAGAMSEYSAGGGAACMAGPDGAASTGLVLGLAVLALAGLRASRRRTARSR